MSNKKQILVVRSHKDESYRHEVDVTGKNERAVEKVLSGLLRNMSDDYWVDDSKAYMEKQDAKD